MNTLYCCGKDWEVQRTLRPLNTERYINRKIEIAFCEKHDKKIALLTQWDVKNKRWCFDRPKAKNIDSWLLEKESEPYFEGIKLVKQGTKANMAFKYGKTEFKGGTRIDYAVDFNGTKEEIRRITQ